jgi:hypothetical protein
LLLRGNNFRRRGLTVVDTAVDIASIFPRCDPGTFSDERGLAACKLCPSGTFNPETGAFSMGNCLSCNTVSSAHVSDALGAPTSDACVSCAGGEGMRLSNGTHCIPCPAGMWCDGSPEYFLCMGSGSNCLGSAGCAAGYTGYRCMSCARGYFADAELFMGASELGGAYVDAPIECKACPGIEWYRVVGAAFGIAVALVPLGLCVRWGRSRGAPPALSAALYAPAHCFMRIFKRLDHVQQKHRLLFGMFGMHMKRLVVLHNAAGLALPTATRQWLSWSALFSLASADALRPACILPWNQDTSWLAIICLSVTGALLLTVVDFCRIKRMAERSDGTESPTLGEPGVCGVIRGFLTRLLTNSDSDYETTLWSASFTNWMAGAFFPYALRAITCKTSSADGVYFNAYDPTVGGCLAPGHREIYLASTAYVVLYTFYLVYFFVVPFLAPFIARCDNCVQHRAGHEHLRSHRFILSWRLVRNGIPFLSSFVILQPDSPAFCAGLMVTFFVVELLLAAASRCYRSALGAHGRAPFAVYLGCTFFTLLFTALYAGDPKFHASPAVPYWGTFLIVLNFFFFPVCFFAALGCLSLRNHSSDNSLAYTEARQPQKIANFSSADCNSPGPVAGSGGCGGCTLANAWLCVRPLCQSANAPSSTYMFHRHFAVNPDNRERCWYCSQRQETGLKLRVLMPDFSGRAGQFLCVERSSLCDALKPFVEALSERARILRTTTGLARTGPPTGADVERIERDVVKASVVAVMNLGSCRKLGFIDLTGQPDGLNKGMPTPSPAPEARRPPVVLSLQESNQHHFTPRWYLMHFLEGTLSESSAAPVSPGSISLSISAPPPAAPTVLASPGNVAQSLPVNTSAYMSLREPPPPPTHTLFAPPAVPANSTYVPANSAHHGTL